MNTFHTAESHRVQGVIAQQMVTVYSSECSAFSFIFFSALRDTESKRTQGREWVGVVEGVVESGGGWVGEIWLTSLQGMRNVQYVRGVQENTPRQKGSARISRKNVRVILNRCEIL